MSKPDRGKHYDELGPIGEPVSLVDRIEALEQASKVASQVGRTPWDFATEVIRSPAALLLVAAVFILIPLTIHFLAEPNSEINLFGILKYTKPAIVSELPNPAPTPDTTEPVPSFYILPSRASFRPANILPILDGTINIATGFDLQKNRSKYIIGGANLAKTRIAARDFNGNSLNLEFVRAAPQIAPHVFVADRINGCVFEIEYLQWIFQATVSDVGSDAELTVTAIPKPTLDLKSFASN